MAACPPGGCLQVRDVSRLGPVPLSAGGAEFDEIRVQQLVQFSGRRADLLLEQPQLKVDHQLHVFVGPKVFHASGR